MPENNALSLFSNALEKEPDDRASGALELLGNSMRDDSRLRASLYGSTSLNPDQAARDRILSEEYGVPVDTVRRNKDTYTQRAEFDSYDFGKLKRETPLLTANLENPDIAPVIKDDIDSLSYFERWTKDLGQAAQKGRDKVTTTELGTKMMLADFGMGEALTPSEELSLYRATTREGQNYNIGFVPGIPGAVAEMAPLFFESVKDALPVGVGGAVVGGGVGAGTAGPAGVLPGALGGFGRSMAVAVPIQMGMSEMGGAYVEFKNLRDETGQPIEKEVAGGAALVVGLVNGSLESIGFGTLAKNFPGANQVLGKLTTGQVKQMIRTTAGREFFKKLTKSVVEGTVVEGLTESMQEATNVILGEVAKGQSNLDFNVMGVDPNATEDVQLEQFNQFLSDALGRVGEAGIRGAQGGAGFSGAGVTLQQGYDASRALLLRQQEQGQISELFEAARRSKTNQRDPKLFNKITGEMMGDESIYIDAAKMQEYFQSGGDENGLYDAIPEAREQMENALEAGGDLILPANKVAGYAARDEGFLSLQEFMRLSPEAITDQEFQDEYFNRILPEMEYLEEQNISLEQGEMFQRRIKDQIMNAGFTPDTAEQYSTLLREAYETELANAETDDATAIVERMFGNLRIQDGSQPKRRNIIDADDLLIDRARALSKGERAAAQDKRQSLLDYIRKQGGVRNVEEQVSQAGFFGSGTPIQEAQRPSDNLVGDLQAMDIDRAPNGKKKPKAQRILREDGKYLDDLALSAWEAGYFPEFSERPDIDTLVEAIRNELAGQPRYTQEESDRLLRDQSALQFAEQLDREGVDINADNETIKAEIARLKGEEYFQKYTDELDQLLADWDSFIESNPAEKAAADKFIEDQKRLEAEEKQREVDALNAIRKRAESLKEYRDQFGVRTDVAAWTDKRLDRVLSEYSHSNGVETKAQVGFIDPLDFVLATADLARAKQIEQEAGPLERDKIAQEGQTPYLIIENGEIIGHEGRHRMIAMAKEGIGRTPVVIRDYGRGYDTSTDFIKKMNIKAQQFINEGKGAADIQVNDILPIMRSRKEAIKEALNQEKANVLFQGNETKRGSIQFNGPTGEAVINVFENRDLSTILHESGHFFLEVQKALAEHPDASPERVERWNKMLDWMGVKDGNIERKHHEKFAEAFELYLEKGEAPSIELKDAFRRFKSWLISLWRRLPQLKPDLKIPAEVQDFFNRMLATDDKIEQMRSMPVFRPDPNVLALLNDQEKKQYVRRSEEAIKSAKEDLLKKALKEKMRENAKWWKEERARVRDEVEDRIKNMPIYKAHDFLTKGIVRTPEGDVKADKVVKLSRKTIKNQYDEEYIKYLPRGTTQQSGGVNPSLIAEQFGFANGEEFLRELANLKPMKEAIESETDATMLARHGDMLNDGTLEREALESMQGDKKADVLSSELAWVSRYTGEKYPGKAGFKARAREILADMRVDNAIKPSKYYYAEVKHARNAGKLLAQKDFEGYAEAKSKQLLNHYLYSESSAARTETEKALKRFNKYIKKPKKGAVRMDEDYRQKIIQILDKYDLGPRISDAKRLRLEMQALDNWIKAQNAGDDAVTLIMPPELLEADSKTHYRDLTLNEFKALSDMVDNIATQGKNKRTLMLNGERRDLDVDRAKVADAIIKNSNPTGLVNSHKTDRNRRRLLKNIAGTLLTPDQLVKDLDGREDLGIVYEHIKAPIDRAVSEKLLPMRDDLAEKLDKLYSILPKETIRELKLANTHKKLTKLYEVTSSRAQFNKEELLSLALNWGNESNRDALIEGLKKQGISEEAIEENIFSNLTKPEWDFVQATWDLFNEYWPETAKLERQRTGFAPEKIDAAPVETPYGVYDGGYFPLKYDSNQSLWVNEETIEEKVKDMRAGRFGRAATKRGRTIERVGSGGRPVLLELGVITSALTETVQDLAMGEAVTYVDRVMNSKQVKDAFSESNNIEYARALDIWLKDVAAGEMISGDAVSQLFRKVRTNFTISVLGLNFGTALLQPIGYTATLAELGGKYSGIGLKKLLTTPWMGENNVFAQVNNASGFMAERGKTFNKDIWDAQRKALGKITDIPANIVKAFFWHIAKAQQLVDTATWLGAYQKGIDQFGDEGKAIQYADRTVARTQSSGVFSDRTAIERGTISNSVRQTELIRIWTTLISYFIAKSSLAYNKTAQTDFKDIGQVMKWSMDMSLMFFVEGAIVAAIRNQWPDDDDEQSKFMFGLGIVRSSVMAGIPFVREFDSELGGFRGGSAMSQLYDRFGKASEQLSQGEFDKALVKNMNSLGGILIGYPSSATNKIINYLWDVSEGEDVSAADALIYREKD